MREDDRAADHLVGVAGIDPEPEVGLDGGVERDGRGVLRELGRLFGAVDALAVDELRRLEVLLAVSHDAVPF